MLKAIERADSNIQDRFGEVLLPEEQQTEVRNGERKVTRRIKIPGYLFVEVDLEDDPRKEVEILIRNTPRIVEFKKAKLPQKEIDHLRGTVTAVKPKAKVITNFKVGEVVRIIDGAFSGMTGAVEELTPSRQRLRVKVSIFGRMTSVDLEYEHVERSK